MSPHSLGHPQPSRAQKGRERGEKETGLGQGAPGSITFLSSFTYVTFATHQEFALSAQEPLSLRHTVGGALP